MFPNSGCILNLEKNWEMKDVKEDVNDEASDVTVHW
jgi:hypothetical protein